jgi:hypothetical protein
MGGAARSGDEGGRGIVVTGSGLEAADSDMVSSFLGGAGTALSLLTAARSAAGPNAATRNNEAWRAGGRGLLADAEQGGRHRIDPGPLAWTGHRWYAALRAS